MAKMVLTKHVGIAVNVNVVVIDIVKFCSSYCFLVVVVA